MSSVSADADVYIASYSQKATLELVQSHRRRVSSCSVSSSRYEAFDLKEEYVEALRCRDRLKQQLSDSESMQQCNAFKRGTRRNKSCASSTSDRNTCSNSPKTSPSRNVY
ncbi:hypothetical protein PC129_g15947 [Phytophthora cactorum]|uniref:Uncharacterized protein n=1 Tax=Phytophthora cactorum TaxID=29920 RepID=A0A8T1HMC5_9STRA|nr:hypothetical protein Pcac1_g20930 [Phytophthora cactorum]KAG2886708.1 hypothetical protein PC114_g19126 [Phytophthora cactorum]KAG2940149.1 hypothetical protein PC117_g10635 [Phytophthora cactorum]KAG3019451.1 hypothetical protein PC119_g10324 [Phytophthora cactorum]KAG3021812.1 hypothetical protein PC120_g8475 [Phytophthora cactorum]